MAIASSGRAGAQRVVTIVAVAIASSGRAGAQRVVPACGGRVATICAYNDRGFPPGP